MELPVALVAVAVNLLQQHELEAQVHLGKVMQGEATVDLSAPHIPAGVVEALEQ
jgi:hypothetical protein